MIKLDTSIMQDVQSEELKGYWMDFDEGRAAFTMEVNDIGLNDDVSEIIQQLMEGYND